MPAPRTNSSRWLLHLLAGGVVLILLLPTIYLLVRVLEAGPSAWSSVFSRSNMLTLGRTAVLAVAVTAASGLIALPAAWLTTRTDLPHRRLLAVLLALPVVIPSYVGAYLMVAFLSPRGMLATWLGLAPLPSIYGFPGAFILLTLLSYPYIFLGLRAVLQGLDPALEEAARSLGYSPIKTFLYVTLPQLRPALAAGGLLVALYVLRDFGAVSIMRYDTFTRVIYIQYKSAFDRSSASSLALVLVALALGLLALEIWTRGRARYHRSASGSRPPGVARLGVWRWPVLALCLAVIGMALVVPVGVLGYWLIRGIQAGERLAPLWIATQNSLLASGLAAGVTLLAALPVVVMSVRVPGRLSGWLYQLAYSGYALPGLVVALALVYFGANFAAPLYQSLTMLVLAYAILFLPQAIGTLRASLLQVHIGLEEAARGLGRSPLRALVEVILPLMRSGILAACALVFLTAMKELPATLILSPFGYKTLAVDVWSAVSEAFFARAAAPALMLILLSSIPAAILLYWEQR
jgi:iron(III) transport system permease protein